ncbi:MAG: aminotransferase class III-fold pyridoxal phosphate-dependent enzyme, partial [Candidatus Hydrogenedentes bacterium]|nr:aminotransferase class III-fold pyridoxal phosphate-dependent enzyme [Candidatus Hydrogenedentota bacterium]
MRSRGQTALRRNPGLTPDARPRGPHDIPGQCNRVHLRDCHRRCLACDGYGAHKQVVGDTRGGTPLEEPRNLRAGWRRNTRCCKSHFQHDGSVFCCFFTTPSANTTEAARPGPAGLPGLPQFLPRRSVSRNQAPPRASDALLTADCIAAHGGIRCSLLRRVGSTSHGNSGSMTEESQTGALYRHAKTRIPGGTQLLSKRPEMFLPDQWPAYFSRANGCEVWDLDGHRYFDFTHNGVGSCLLGYADPDVTRAVVRRVESGSMCTLNAPEEVALADRLCAIHPWAESVRFTRCGGEACAVAARIARATTDRSLIAICGYHGWQDWYLAANLGEGDALRGHLLPGLDPLGVPRELRGTAVTFPFNDRAAFAAIRDRYGSRLAAVFLEPCRYQDPEPGFLECVRDGIHAEGGLLVFDEITIGWRLVHGGAHLRLGVTPDMAVFAKALGNGHPIGAVIGTREAMSGAQASFISSTYWTESVGP